MATKVVITGTAQDVGIPSPGCSCPHCDEARTDPKVRRFPASIALISEIGEVMMIDCTPEFPNQWALIGHPRMAGIVLTHAHMGHYTGLMYLGREGPNLSNVPTFGTESMIKFLKENAPWRQLVEISNLDLNPLNWWQGIRFGGDVEVMLFSVPHRAEYTDTAGVLVKGKSKTLVYIPDIDTWDQLDKSTTELVRNADISIVDGTFYSATELKQLSSSRAVQNIPHPTMEESLQFFRGSRTKLVFTHLNHTNFALDRKYEEELKKHHVWLAREGDTFYLD